MEKRLSEEQRKKIEEESKKLLIEFNQKLEKIKFRENTFISEKKGGRKEGRVYSYDEEFRKIFLKNAPEKNDNSIIAERGSWK